MRGDSGPFAAAIFETGSGKLVAPGVNLVVPARNSVLHAEIVAIMIAQRVVGHWDLGAEGMPPYELVCSTDPCAMCLGAIPWSGVRRLVCGARDEDARAIGFDEGLKPENWLQGFEERGISVVRDVMREEARAVLREYAQSGGVIYNGRQTGSKPTEKVTPDEQ
jgi:tRNA(Arg) A34 adenosine deaminase TadA